MYKPSPNEKWSRGSCLKTHSPQPFQRFVTLVIKPLPSVIIMITLVIRAITEVIKPVTLVIIVITGVIRAKPKVRKTITRVIRIILLVIRVITRVTLAFTNFKKIVFEKWREGKKNKHKN